MLLEEAGVDPGLHVDPVTCVITEFLRLRWAVVAQHDFFPGPVWPLFEGWASAALAGMTRWRSKTGP